MTFQIEDGALTLEEWLEQTSALREKLYLYGKSNLPVEGGQRHIDMDEAIQNADDAGRLVADAESYLTQATAQATIKIKAAAEKYTEVERRALVKDAVRQIQHLRDALAVTQRSIRDRIYVSMNENRARA